MYSNADLIFPFGLLSQDPRFGASKCRAQKVPRTILNAATTATSQYLQCLMGQGWPHGLGQKFKPASIPAGHPRCTYGLFPDTLHIILVRRGAARLPPFRLTVRKGPSLVWGPTHHLYNRV